jgi:hypothetical protein
MAMSNYDPSKFLKRDIRRNERMLRDHEANGPKLPEALVEQLRLATERLRRVLGWWRKDR